MSQWFDRGNYAAAYETLDFEGAWDAAVASADATPQAWPDHATDAERRRDFMLGFFSSYELGEVDPELQDELAGYRGEYDNRRRL